MIYLELFLNFLKIGAVSFGGGYGMISIIRETVIANNWMTESDFLNFVAISESTPGPLAVNIATFIGSAQGGFAGAAIATAGVVLPSFVVILLIAAVIKNLLKFAGVNAFLTGIRPAIVGLILATAVTMLMTSLLGFSAVGDSVLLDWKNCVLFVLLLAIAGTFKLFRKKSISPILLILVAGGLGIVINLIPLG